MIPIDIQVSRSKVKPILYMLEKGGISVLQKSILFLVGGGWLICSYFLKSAIVFFIVNSHADYK